VTRRAVTGNERKSVAPRHSITASRYCARSYRSWNRTPDTETRTEIAFGAPPRRPIPAFWTTRARHAFDRMYTAHVHVVWRVLLLLLLLLCARVWRFGRMKCRRRTVYIRIRTCIHIYDWRDSNERANANRLKERKNIRALREKIINVRLVRRYEPRFLRSNPNPNRTSNLNIKPELHKKFKVI